MPCLSRRYVDPCRQFRDDSARPWSRCLQLLTIGFCFTLLGGCLAVAPPDDPAPAIQALRNITICGIREPGFPENGGVRLAEGTWLGPPFAPDAAGRPMLVLLTAPTASADLDGDGTAERVALLAASSGGSGERLYLAVFSHAGGLPENRATILVGDRSKPRALAIEDATILLDVVEIGPGQPACCGTQRGRHRYRLGNAGLVEVGHEVQGSPSAGEQ